MHYDDGADDIYIHYALCQCFAQLETAAAVLERIKTRDPPPEKDVSLRTLEDLYPVVTEQQKVETLEKFSVSYYPNILVYTEFLCNIMLQ